MTRPWNECLPTGWEPLDREHAELIQRLGAVLSAVNAHDAPRARLATDGLFRTVSAHFAEEERLMREHAYPQLARHKEAHDLFLADVAAFAAVVASEGITAQYRRWATGRMLEWFRFHVSANDVALGVFLSDRTRRAAPAGAAPAAPKAR